VAKKTNVFTKALLSVKAKGPLVKRKVVLLKHVRQSNMDGCILQLHFKLVTT
jgi:hypothetical protein